MVQEMRHVTFEEFASNLNSLFDWVVQERKPLLVVLATGQAVELRPVRHARPPRPRRPRTAADHEAFLAAAGSWSDVDGEELLRRVYESRDLPPRPLVEL